MKHGLALTVALAAWPCWARDARVQSAVELYASADPTKNGTSGFTIATVGSGLPTSGGQIVASLNFETAPEQPFAYSMLTLGLGSEPDTIYVADNKLGGVSKYGLLGGKWVRKGTVEIPFVTGVTANDANGVVTIYATSSGKDGTTGTLYKLSDVSGVNGTLTGVPVEIATAPANEAFRGVAFAPGTTFFSRTVPLAGLWMVTRASAVPRLRRAAICASLRFHSLRRSSADA